MANNENNSKKYASLSTLQSFLDNLKMFFATKTDVDGKSNVQIVTTNEGATSVEHIPTLKIHKMTQEQYEDVLSSGNIDSNAIYLTPDEETDLSLYATIEQLDRKADVNHIHEIDDVNELQTALDELLNESKKYSDNLVSNKADVLHTHDDLYYTETEMDEKISTINNSVSNLIAEVKLYAENGDKSTLEKLKIYTDNAVAQKSQVQIITWEDDD